MDARRGAHPCCCGTWLHTQQRPKLLRSASLPWLSLGARAISGCEKAPFSTGPRLHRTAAWV